MTADPADPRWPKLLSLTVHELRTPMTVVAGYVRMLLKERAGPVSEEQRRLLEEAEKSCARLSALLAEVSELSGLEAGTAPFNRSEVDFRAVLREAAAGLPQLADRSVAVQVQTQSGPLPIHGDVVRLRSAVSAVIGALRRELVASDRLVVHEHIRRDGDRDVSWVAVGHPDRIAALSATERGALTSFDEWRGGVGLSLAVARRVINAHGGAIWSPQEDSRAGAVLTMPV
jgi:signal transduction histidine kinase